MVTLSKAAEGQMKQQRANEEKHERELKSRLAKLLIGSNDPWTVATLSDRFECSEGDVTNCLRKLAKEGRRVIFLNEGVQISTEMPPSSETIPISNAKARWIRFGATADNHLCSKYSRLQVLNALFDRWQEQGIKTVYQMGNIIDGECNYNKYDLYVRGVQGQTDYLIDNWPHRKGITTRFITGDDHEGWYIQREGINIGEYIEQRAKKAGRNDLIYLGHMEHNITFTSKEGASQLRLIHTGGGTAYAISYNVQKLAESLQGGEKPTMLLLGHSHKYDYSYPREIHAIQVGCTIDQTPYMRKKRLQAMVGGCTVEILQDEHGIVREVKATWMPFYDRKFYTDKLWKYHWK
jgi:hypothetical protein